MNEDEIPELEISEHSGRFTRDGITVIVDIYRLVDSDEGWSLEVVDEDGNSTVWDDLFATDEAAWDEFLRAVDEEGIGELLGPIDQVH